MFMDNSFFHIGIKTHPAPPPTHLVLFVVHRISALEVLISENENVSDFKMAKNSQGDPQEKEICMLH